MRVPSDRGAAPAAPASRSGDTPAESKSFEKVLESKNEDRQNKKAHGAGEKMRRPVAEPDGKEAIGAGMTPFGPLADQGPTAVAPSSAMPDIKQLDGLVREILVVAGPGGNPKVEVQFQSSTLQGLNVRIERKGDEVSIRLLTGSNSVAQLLSQNVDQLSQALHAKGVNVGPIQVELTPTQTRSSDGEQQPRDGRRGRDDERQDKRQR